MHQRPTLTGGVRFCIGFETKFWLLQAASRANDQHGCSGA
jgi:hypothetical protein